MVYYPGETGNTNPSEIGESHIMQLNGLNLVDTASVLPYYQAKNLSLELLRQCNSQEFRFIDGYGKGYFLLTQNIATSTVSFTVGSRTVTLKVLDKLSLEHPNHSGGLIVYMTAEPKYLLLESVVSRNYNVTIPKSVPTYGPPTVVTLAPDQPTKTLEEVIDSFLPSGYTLQYNAASIKSFDISIEGLSVLRAIDHLCSIYGLIWTATTNTVYIWDMEEADPSSSALPELTDPINDIRHTKLDENLSSVSVSFPVYNYCRHVPKEYYTWQDVDNAAGQSVNVMDPYYPAVLTTLGSLRNTSVLNTRAQLISNNLKAIENSLEYAVKNFFEANPLSVPPFSLSEIYGDMGNGPRSIYRAIPYPFVPAKQPPAQARYADNWIGVLTDGYYGSVAILIVTPLYGLDGKEPPGPQAVVNLYGWNYGEAGWRVRVEWDCVNGQWIALQQEYDCPPEEEPPPPTPTDPVDPYDYEGFPFPPEEPL